MSRYYYDLHIHSCLSPCGDDMMTPGNILGMAHLKGLDMVAIADHNCARNLPAAKIIADAYGILLVPAMEITTREEVHMLAYFPDVDTALRASEDLRAHLPKKKNKPSFFGHQQVMNDDGLVDVYSVAGALVRKGVKRDEALKGLLRGVYMMDNKKFLIK